jgi:hypothetical protein
VGEIDLDKYSNDEDEDDEPTTLQTLNIGDDIELEGTGGPLWSSDSTKGWRAK